MDTRKIDYFLRIAKEVGTQSTCRKKVGAVVVDPKTNFIVSTGYCGTPSGVASCDELGGCLRQRLAIPSGTSYDMCRSIHAEQNAILQAGVKNIEGCYMFMVGQPFVCDMCKRYIAQARIAMVYIADTYPGKLESLCLEEIKFYLERQYMDKMST